MTGTEQHELEAARQHALRRYGILDTPPELAFDCIVSIVARVLDVPIAALGFLDGERQWFKSRVGLEVAEMPRSISFCSHTIRSSGATVVPDARLDDRFAGNPLVVGPPGLRFYAGVPLVAPGEVPVGTLAVASLAPRRLDETETFLLRRMAALAVEELEARAGEPHRAFPLGLLVERSPAVLWTADASLRVTASTGPEPERMLASPDVAVYHRRAVRGESVCYATVCDGRDFLARLQPIRSPAGQVVGAAGAAIDVTERNRQQAQAVQADHLGALATLAAGVAHEINNPLAYVLANASVAIDELAGLALEVPARLDGRLAELRSVVEDIAQGADRAAAIVRDLRLFARGEGDPAETSDLRAAVMVALRMTRSELLLSARLKEELAEVPAVRGSSQRLVSILVNILVNAAQAFGGGRAADNQIAVRTRACPDGWAEVEIVDTGPGIEPEAFCRVFDPFFTTKPVGAGRGLGLSMCHGIVTGLGGRIELGRGTDGKGTAVRVLLPPAVPPVAPAPPRIRVLVVDDEEAVCRSLRRVLGPAIDTEVRHSGREAIALLDRDRRFDAVVCEVLMREVSGADVFEHLSTSAPELAARMVFVTTGGIPPPIAGRIPIARLVEKPFDGEAVRDLVATIARGAPVR